MWRCIADGQGKWFWWIAIWYVLSYCHGSKLILFFMLIVTELLLASHFHYVNQECLLQDTMVGTHLKTLSIQDDMGFGGTSSEFLAC